LKALAAPDEREWTRIRARRRLDETPRGAAGPKKLLAEGADFGLVFHQKTTPKPRR